MQIIVNDESRQFAADIKITELIVKEGLADQLCAVAVNGVFVPKAKHENMQLNDGDLVEIVSPREGG